LLWGLWACGRRRAFPHVSGLGRRHGESVAGRRSRSSTCPQAVVSHRPCVGRTASANTTASFAGRPLSSGLDEGLLFRLVQLRRHRFRFAVFHPQPAPTGPTAGEEAQSARSGSRRRRPTSARSPTTRVVRGSVSAPSAAPAAPPSVRRHVVEASQPVNAVLFEKPVPLPNRAVVKQQNPRNILTAHSAIQQHPLAAPDDGLPRANSLRSLRSSSVRKPPRIMLCRRIFSTPPGKRFFAPSHRVGV